MDAAFWHERWKNNEIGFHQSSFNNHLLKFWPALDIKPEAPVFVPLCGKSQDLLWLRTRGHSVVGVEISPVAVRDFFVENQLTPAVTRHGPFEVWVADGVRIFCGDFFALTPAELRDVQGVFDRAALIALPPELRARYVSHLFSILPSEIQILLVTMEYSGDTMQGPPFSVLETEVHALYEPRFQIARLLSQDILDQNPRFRERGLDSLHEKVYRLT